MKNAENIKFKLTEDLQGSGVKSWSGVIKLDT